MMVPGFLKNHVKIEVKYPYRMPDWYDAGLPDKFREGYKCKIMEKWVFLHPWDLTCHQCHKDMVFYIDQDGRIDGECPRIHGGFSTPADFINETQQTTLDRWF